MKGKVSKAQDTNRGPVDHEVRDQIIQAAGEHFRHYGYMKTTVSELAKSIGFSKAYIYKFFASKQAIGEMICSGCLSEIETEVKNAVNAAGTPPEKMRQMFQTCVSAGLRLFFHDHKIYEIAAAAALEGWSATEYYDQRMRQLLQQIIQEGRLSGDFERKTPMDEILSSIYLVMRPYMNPLLLQHDLDGAERAATYLSSLILRSLSP